MGGHYNQVDTQPGCHAENLGGRIARHYMQFVTGPGLDFLMAHFLKLGSGRSLHFGCGMKYVK